MIKVFSKISIIIILIVLVVGGIFAWQYFGTPEEKVVDETADWKTYYNERYSIEFKYPKLWVLDEKNALAADHPDQNRNFVQINVFNGVPGPQDESMSSCQPGIATLVFQVGKLRESQQTFEEFVNFQIENPERGKPPTVKPELIQTTLGGHNAFEIKDVYDSCEKDFYYVEQSSDRYMTISFIVDKNEDKLIINQILSTFRFIETPDETAGWQIYKNEEYGFEIKYSKDWMYEQNIFSATKPSLVFCPLSLAEVSTGGTICKLKTEALKPQYEAGMVYLFNNISDPKPNNPDYRYLGVNNLGYYYYLYSSASGNESIVNQMLATFRFLE